MSGCTEHKKTFKMSIKRITMDSMAVSSLAGLSRIINSDTRFLRSLWVFGVLALFAVCCWETYNVTSQFLSYAASTSITGKSSDFNAVKHQ